MNPLSTPPALARWTRSLEEDASLDGAVHTLEGPVHGLFASGTRGAVLRGDWLGHPLHPVLTDVVLGTWLSASVLDVLGRGTWSDPARALIGVGAIAFVPTAWSGWAQWAQAGPREQRVGVVHAGVNATALVAYAGSWLARRRGHDRAGARLALLGAGVLVVGGYLGGHLTDARRAR